MEHGTKGWGSGLLGVVIFSGSLPATRLAVGGFSPLFLTSARAVIAALLGFALLMLRRQVWPQRGELVRLSVTGVGVVIGYPLLSALALQHMTSARSLVFVALLPLATALCAVCRGAEAPRPAFWVFSVAGALAVMVFALTQGGHTTLSADLLMVAAVALCGLGYAEGAALSRRLGGWQVISWALVLTLPVMAVGMLATWPPRGGVIAPSAWGGLVYVSIFSMLLGFVFWYRGLALGGTARIGQLQLLQPFLGLVLAHVLLGEAISRGLLAVALVVMACVTGARRHA